MEPVIALNYMAIAVCVILGMARGFVWFELLFSKAWARHMGMEDVAEPEGAAMAKSMTIFFLSNVLIVYVLAHTLGVWRASAWGLSPACRRSRSRSTPQGSPGSVSSCPYK